MLLHLMGLAASLCMVFPHPAEHYQHVTNMTNKRETSIVIWALFAFLLGFGSAGISSYALKQQVLSSIFMGMTGAFLSFFLQFSYVQGHIFHQYYRWLEKLRDNVKHPLHVMSMPLGLCAYCQNMWITMIIFAAGVMWFDVSWWMFIPATGIAHFGLSVLDKLFWT